MKKISPLGALYLSLVTKYWNVSTDTNSKKEIADLICSNDAHLIRQIEEKIVNLVIRASGQQLIISFALEGVADFYFPGFSTENENIIKVALSDCFEYMRNMFKAGHFDQIPMPEFCIHEMTEVELNQYLKARNEIRYGDKPPQPITDGDDTTAGTIRAAEKIISKLPQDLAMTFPPRAKEDEGGDDGVG